jgi:hypothetical protein
MFNLGTPTGEFNGQPWYEDVYRDKGEKCHECGRLLKVYHRRLSRSMTRGLLRLYRLELIHTDRKFFHVKMFDKEGARGEFGVVSSWGLTIAQPNETFGKKASGYWCLTEFGRRFILLREKVPQYVILKWGSELLGFSGPMVDAKECLEQENQFDYDELMAWTPEEQDLF